MTPIDLPDDGTRYHRHGHTQAGRYRYVCHHNPELIAAAIARKIQRRQIRETNIQRWT